MVCVSYLVGWSRTITQTWRRKPTYCMTGYRGYAIYAIPLSPTGDITDTDNIAWHNTEAAPYVLSPVLYPTLG